MIATDDLHILAKTNWNQLEKLILGIKLFRYREKQNLCRGIGGIISPRLEPLDKS